jgi:SET domain-containing protein
MLYVKTRLDGPGCFADEDISKGTIVWKFVPGFDQEFPREFIQKLSTPSRQQFLKYAYISKSTNNYVLCSDDARFFSYSENSNIKNVALEGEQEGIDIATQDIKAGDELTHNRLF